MVLSATSKTQSVSLTTGLLDSVNTKTLTMEAKLAAWRLSQKKKMETAGERMEDKENRNVPSNTMRLSTAMAGSNPTKPRPKTPLPKMGMGLPKKTTFAYKTANREMQRRRSRGKESSSLGAGATPTTSGVATVTGFARLKNLKDTLAAASKVR